MVLLSNPSITQTSTFGNTTASGGTAFNDLTTIGLFPDQYVLDRTSPIERIDFRGVNSVEGLTIHYRGHPAVTHGRKTGPTKSVTLDTEEVILALVGIAGPAEGPLEVRPTIVQLRLTILDKSTGVTRIEGPFGDATTSLDPFFVDGPVVAFGGRANAQNTDNNHITVGIHSLSVFTAPF